MDIPTFGTGDFATLALGIGVVLLAVAMLIVAVAVITDDNPKTNSLAIGAGGGVVGALAAVVIVLVLPVAVVATFFYTPPPAPPVSASTVTLTESDGRDTQSFGIVCDGRRGEVELRGTEGNGAFTSAAYRFRAERGDLSEPARFSVGLRWENKGWGSRFGGQPSWMENVVSGGREIRADGEWQAGYLDRPIILSRGSEYVLRVNLGSGPCPHLIALR